MQPATTARALSLALILGVSLCGCSSSVPQDSPTSSSAREAGSRADAARNADLTFSKPKFTTPAQTTVVGDTVTGEVEVTNESDTDVSVGEMNFLGTGAADAGAAAFSVVGNSCQGVVPARSSCTITVGFTPTEVGTASAVLQVYIPDDNSVLDIPVTRRAMAAGTQGPTPTPTDAPTIDPPEPSESSGG